MHPAARRSPFSGVTPFGGRVAAAATDFPSHLRDLGWLPLAMVETDDAPFPEAERLRPERLRSIAESFDPDILLPPIITGAHGGGPGHVVGEWSPPLGFIHDLDFDGVTLWGRATELVEHGQGKVSASIAQGMTGRSIGFWTSKSDIEGGWALRHLLLIAAEPEGILGMPPLTDYLLGAIGPMEAPLESARVASGDIAQRTWNEQPTEELMTTPATPEAPATPAPDAEDFDARVAAAVERALASRTTQSTEDAADPPEAAPAAPPATDTAAQIASLARTVENLAQVVTSDRDSAERAAVARTFDDLVTSGRVSPAEREPLTAAVMALSGEARAGLIATLSARTPQIPDPWTPPTDSDGNTFDLRSIPTDPEATSRTSIDALARARAAAGKDATPEQVLAAAEALYDPRDSALRGEVH